TRPAAEPLAVVGRQGRAVERPRLPRAVKLGERRNQRRDVIWRGDNAGARLADQLGGGALGRDGCENRPLGREILEHLPREDALPAPARRRNEQEQRVRVALQRKRLAARSIGMGPEPVTGPERPGPLAVGNAEVPDEARDDVLEPRLRERLQERPRVAFPEEAPGMGDAEAVGAAVLEPGEVVEVGAV